MREEFKFRITGTSVLLSFAELDKTMRERFEYERDEIEKRLNKMAIMGIIDVAEVDTKMQAQMQHERDTIERRLVEIFDTRLQAKNDTMSLGMMKTGDVMSKFK